MHSLQLLILQIAVVLIVSRIVGWIFRKIHQPQVVGEMVAGIILGPSLLGWLWPVGAATIFPPESVASLNVLSQIGLLLFMFIVGLEIDAKLLRERSNAAVMISHASIIAPFLLGAGLSLYLYTKLSDSSVTFIQFALFMGAAMSITAFPVLARILTERKLLRTKIGSLAIACAAVDDVTAWCILAVVVAIVRLVGLNQVLMTTILGSLVYVAIMLFGIRPLLRTFEHQYLEHGQLKQNMLATILILILASSWTTEMIGIHTLFGAFMLGVIMPRNPKFVHAIIEKLHDVTVVFLLPLFFAYTGLRTSIGLISGWEMWIDCSIIIMIATIGKFGGSTIAARASGMNWREAGAIGILMNTRGLMELVILNIGLDLGVISPALFAMMVIMALVTTFITTPLMEWLYPTQAIIEDNRLPTHNEALDASSKIAGTSSI